MRRAIMTARTCITGRNRQTDRWICPSITSSARSRPASFRSGSGPVSSSHISVEVLAGAGFDWLLLDCRALAQRAAHGAQPAPGGRRRHGASDRPPAVERRGAHQGLSRRGRADLPRALRAERGGGATGRGGDALSAARRPRLRRRDARVALRPRQGLPRALRGGDLRARPGRDAGRARQPRGDREGRGRGRRVHRPGRSLGGHRASRRTSRIRRSRR